MVMYSNSYICTFLTEPRLYTLSLVYQKGDQSAFIRRDRSPGLRIRRLHDPDARSCRLPADFNHASLSVFESSRLTMISSVITHRARPRGDGAPSGAVLMALGASLPFSIIMWTTGATAQSETSQVGDEEGARMFLSDSFFKLTQSWFSDEMRNLTVSISL